MNRLIFVEYAHVPPREREPSFDKKMMARSVASTKHLKALKTKKCKKIKKIKKIKKYIFFFSKSASVGVTRRQSASVGVSRRQSASVGVGVE